MNKDQINRKLLRGEIMEVSNTDKKTLEIMASLEKSLKLVREIKNDKILGFKILYQLVK